MVFEDLLGKTVTQIENRDDCELIFTTKDGTRYMLYHDQDCCESVSLEEIVGDLDDLIGEPLLMAEEVTQEDERPSVDYGMWTFYKLATIKGYVTIRWYGHSNGYYSVDVNFKEITDDYH